MYPSLIFAAAWPFLSPLFLQLSFTAFWDCGILTYFECYEFSFLDSLIQCVQNLWRIRVRNVPFPYNEILFVLNEIQMLAWWIIRVGRLFVLLSSFSKKNVFLSMLETNLYRYRWDVILNTIYFVPSTDRWHYVKINRTYKFWVDIHLNC